MTERAPHRPAPEAPAAWDTAAIAAALERQPEATVDAVLGPGLRFRLGAVRPVALDLFPAAGVVRLTGGDVQLALFRQQAGPRLVPEGLVFPLPSHPDGRFLAVSPAGEVTLFLAPSAPSTATDANSAPERPQDRPDPANRPKTHLDAQEPLPGDSVPSDGVSSEPSPATSEDATTTKEQGYIPRLTGRLARKPRFHTNRKGVLVGEFDLGVKDQDDPTKTTWHAIAVFGDRAEQLKEGFQKGDLVDVIGGYTHVREFVGRDGRPRRKEQIYPTVVKRR
jgi:hypothetical protein